MKINDAGLNLLKRFEGCSLEAYKCPAGVWTIGYGHTGNGVHEGQKITQEQASSLLKQDVVWFETGVRTAIGGATTTENQFSAMVCFAYNIGLRAFTKTTVLRYHIAGKKAQAAEAFTLWNKVKGQVVPGLAHRREMEARLYKS